MVACAAVWTACATPAADKAEDTDVVDTDVADSDTDVEVIDTDALDAYDYAALPEMTALAPGVFTMGSPEEERGHTEVEAAHQVTLTHAFEIGTYEVMQGQVEAWTGRNPAYWGGCRRCPVESVSWHQAAFVANQLSDEAGLASCYTCQVQGEAVQCMPAGDPISCAGYRLPTEAEWEYVARSEGTQTGATLSGGAVGTEDDLRSCEAPLVLSDASDLGDQAWYCGNSDATPGSTTRRVGQRMATSQGVHDMLGNVWEWCHDGWTEVLDADAVDPTGDDEAATKVVRGGGWNSAPRELRLGFRTVGAPGTVHDNLGFRVARTLPGE